MKIDTTFQSAFLFNPELSIPATWPAVPRSNVRRAVRSRSLVTETQISYKQEFVCGVILMLCLLFSLAAFVAQFALA